MPVLEIEAVTDDRHPLPDGLAARLADAAGEVMGSSPGQTWVRLRDLPRNDYAESGGDLPEGVLPVFVRVLRADLPAPPELDREMLSLAQAVAGAFRRPVENVHVLYEPAARGRIGFGGNLLR
jgi:phenylpyruvate tautomerase PptA (4-oxalocrotonate tautomerase family)